MGAGHPELHKPAQGTVNLFSVESSGTAHEGRLVPSLVVNYARNPLVRRDEDGKITEKIIENLTTLNVMAVYGILDNVEVGADIPIGFTYGPGMEALGSEGVSLGDIRLLSKWRILGDGKEGFGLAFSLPISLPNGDEDRGQGSGTVVLNPRAIVDGRLGGVLLTANLGFRYRASTKQVDTLALGNELTYGAGAAVELGRPTLLAMAEVFGAARVETVQDATSEAPLEAIGGLRWRSPIGLILTGGAGVGIIADYGSPDVRAVLALAWDPEREPPPPGDRDGDGLLDPDDQCPDDPEDFDGFQDADGCPDLDNDGDGIPDTEDQCPNEAEDKDGYEDADGCPELDNDGDGILDAQDKCPNEPEDFDGFQDEDGCPDLDNDADGIPDLVDRCPNEPETINGFQDEDGCPDQIEVKITKTRLDVLGKVFFDFDKDTIKEVSFPVLDAVADTLAKNPQLKKIRVEGHTDNKGSNAYNDSLSQRRAESVQRYLIDKGIEASRLTAKGYGMRQPLEPHGTPEADDRNRRVEFTILDK